MAGGTRIFREKEKCFVGRQPDTPFSDYSDDERVWEVQFLPSFLRANVCTLTVSDESRRGIPDDEAAALDDDKIAEAVSSTSMFTTSPCNRCFYLHVSNEQDQRAVEAARSDDSCPVHECAQQYTANLTAASPDRCVKRKDTTVAMLGSASYFASDGRVPTVQCITSSHRFESNPT